MCSGRLDLEFVLRAFSDGMDGVFVGGCRLGECNYVTHGNYDALNMVHLARRMMEHMGLDPERLRIDFLSSGEGNLFAELVNDFVKKVKELGPLGKGEGLDEKKVKSQLEAVTKLVPYIKMAKREKLALHLVDAPEKYSELYTRDEVDRLLTEVPTFCIDRDKCKACMICFRRCPVEAIAGGKNQIHVINQDKCIKCGTCLEVCPSRFGAVKKIIAEPVHS